MSGKMKKNQWMKRKGERGPDEEENKVYLAGNDVNGYKSHGFAPKASVQREADQTGGVWWATYTRRPQGPDPGEETAIDFGC
jgi:hypothetical protein